MKAISLLVVAALLSACGPSSSPPQPPVADAHAQAQAAMELPGGQSGIVVVRLTWEGRPLEVSSVFPVVLAEATVGGQVAKTIFRVNDTGSGFVMFSRDLPGRKSLRSELGVAQLARGHSFTFPVVQPDGSLKEQRFTFERLLRPN